MSVRARATAPVAKVDPTPIVTHDDERVDDYFWLRERDNPDVLAYLEAENAYTDAALAHTEQLQGELYEEMLDRIKQTDESAPYPDGGYLYYTRTVEGLQYPIHCRTQDDDGDEEVLLDENELAAGHDYFRLGVFEVSPDHTLLAYSSDTNGSEQFRLVVKDLRTGELLADAIENTSYSLAWANDNRTFLYTVLDDARRPFKVFRHELGNAPAVDALVFHDDDDAYFVNVYRETTGRFLFIATGSNTTTETWFLDASRPQDDATVVAPRRHEIEYHVRQQGERFVIWTNDGAKDFKLVEAPLDAPDPDNWAELIPHRDGVKIEVVVPFADHLAITERANGLRRIRIERVSTGETHEIEMPEPAYTLYPSVNALYETAVFRFGYQSLVTPPSTFDYDMASRERTLVKQQEVLGGYDPADYVTDRILATAPDGVQVPVSLVHRRDLARDGSARALLYGYGSYGYPIEPAFTSNRLALLDRGFVYAIAHVRGGGDLGERWKDDGKLLRKRNTFTDFVAAAEHLVAEGYTAPERLAIMGGSAGGLLMGAVANMRPDLFAVVVAQVPFVDVVNTMLDPSIPLTVTEYEEWGNPAEPEYYEYMKSYSPYDNVEAKDYPHMLVMAGLNDPRVQYWEPAKWVAKLRALKTDDNVLVLKTQMGAGHAGPSGRYDYLREIALQYAFILDRLEPGA